MPFDSYTIYIQTFLIRFNVGLFLYVNSIPTMKNVLTIPNNKSMFLINKKLEVIAAFQNPTPGTFKKKMSLFIYLFIFICVCMRYKYFLKIIHFSLHFLFIIDSFADIIHPKNCFLPCV